MCMGRFARRISEVAGWTLASRVLGLLRDILLFASLGTGVLNSAFILAFTLPNLFRRLLGEGALTSSSIPVLAESLAKNGEKETHQLFNAIISRLGLFILILQVVAIPAFGLVYLLDGLEERWYLGARLSQVLFPYMLFICLGALACGMLNVFGRFGLAAFNQVWLNLTMIGTILYGLWYMPDNGWGRVLLISSGVLLGGLLQFAAPAIGLARQGWSPKVSFVTHPDLGKILRLFLPGLLGAAIFQINILVCRLLAFSLDDTATGLLYLSSRLVELPLGVFAIAVTTVIFPDLSRLSATGKDEQYANVFTRGLGLIFMITLPAAIGLSVLARPILAFLFEWGLFSGEDVAAATPVLIASTLGLPFFAWSTLLTRAWYARQEMKVPVRLAAVNLFLNLFLGLLFMQFLGAVGLALANSISAMVHCLALQYFLPGNALNRPRLASIVTLPIALLVLYMVARTGSHFIESLFADGKLVDMLSVLTVIPVAVISYFGILWLMRFPLLRELTKD